MVTVHSVEGWEGKEGLGYCPFQDMSFSVSVLIKSHFV